MRYRIEDLEVNKHNIFNWLELLQEVRVISETQYQRLIERIRDVISKEF